MAVPTNIVYPGEDLLHAIKSAGAIAVSTDRQGVGVVSGIRADCSTLEHVIHTSGSCPGAIAWGSFFPCLRISAIFSTLPVLPASPQVQCPRMATG
ncbi:MAG: hypothetical protein WCF90_04505 [Methanomicrobiales archaeon]